MLMNVKLQLYWQPALKFHGFLVEGLEHKEAQILYYSPDQYVAS